MDYIQTEMKGIYRDPHSKALIIVEDPAAKREFMEKVAEKQKVQQEINNIKVKIDEIQDTLSGEISEIKNLVTLLIKNK